VLPLATQKATWLVHFTDLREACSENLKVYNLAPCRFDTAILGMAKRVEKVKILFDIDQVLAQHKLSSLKRAS
jgi:hypothetical protein